MSYGTITVADPAGDAAAAILTDTRVLNGPSDATLFGAPVAKVIQRCAGCVAAAPPKHQSSIAFCRYGVSGMHQAIVTNNCPADITNVSPGRTVRAVNSVPNHSTLPD